MVINIIIITSQHILWCLHSCVDSVSIAKCCCLSTRFLKLRICFYWILQPYYYFFFSCHVLELLACSSSELIPKSDSLDIWYNSMDGILAHHKACNYTGQHYIETCGHTSILQMAFESTIPVFKQSKTVQALHCVATVISRISFLEAIID
jgi:hypothetical protein